MKERWKPAQPQMLGGQSGLFCDRSCICDLMVSLGSWEDSRKEEPLANAIHNYCRTKSCVSRGYTTAAAVFMNAGVIEATCRRVTVDLARLPSASLRQTSNPPQQPHSLQVALYKLQHDHDSCRLYYRLS
ncbi:hypothetical protein IG631_07102 [Alternaria alternata]|nr:hypothetical protein IG631_07102 [Alternaria alternata]